MNTSNWWIGHKVLVSPEWIQSVSWAGSYVDLSINRAAIKDAPVYDADVAFDRDDELEIYDHYGRNPYWHHQREPALA